MASIRAEIPKIYDGPAPKKKYQRESGHVEASKAVIIQPSLVHDEQHLKSNSRFWSQS